MLTVRPERADDASAIHAVHAASFPSLDEARLVTLLREAQSLRVSLVAELDGAVVGHVAFSPVTVAAASDAAAASADGRARAAGVGLAPVAVLEASRRQGIAAALIEAGLEASRAMGHGWAVVIGEPGYYARFGFRPAAEFGLSDEYGGGPAFQALELMPGALPRNAGLVRYAPAFAQLA